MRSWRSHVKVDEGVVRLFGHMKRMETNLLTNRVINACVDDRASLGWIDDVKSALSKKGLSEQSARDCVLKPGLNGRKLLRRSSDWCLPSLLSFKWVYLGEM